LKRTCEEKSNKGGRAGKTEGITSTNKLDPEIREIEVAVHREVETTKDNTRRNIKENSTNKSEQRRINIRSTLRKHGNKTKRQREATSRN
jgi:hypothetical protein